MPFGLPTFRIRFIPASRMRVGRVFFFFVRCHKHTKLWKERSDMLGTTWNRFFGERWGTTTPSSSSSSLVQHPVVHPISPAFPPAIMSLESLLHLGHSRWEVANMHRSSARWRTVCSQVSRSCSRRPCSRCWWRTWSRRPPRRCRW